MERLERSRLLAWIPTVLALAGLAFTAGHVNGRVEDHGVEIGEMRQEWREDVAELRAADRESAADRRAIDAKLGRIDEKVDLLLDRR